MEIQISSDELRKYGLPYSGYNGVKVLEDEITDTSRWSIHHTLVFRWIDGKTYRTEYSEGATECQSESPWEYEDFVECEEVASVPVTTMQWEPVLDTGFHIYETEYPSEGSYCVSEHEMRGVIKALRDGDAEAPDSDFVTVIGDAVKTKSGWHPIEVAKEVV